MANDKCNLCRTVDAEATLRGSGVRVCGACATRAMLAAAQLLPCRLCGSDEPKKYVGLATFKPSLAPMFGAKHGGRSDVSYSVCVPCVEQHGGNWQNVAQRVESILAAETSAEGSA